MGFVDERIMAVFLDKGITYSKDARDSLKKYDALLQEHLQTEEYLIVEEKLNAVLAQYEEEAFWCGFKSGIHFLLSVIAD